MGKTNSINMERVNLLSIDQSSSEVRMTATGQANHSGSTRTKATQGLISHFMLLAGVMLIALLTSGKAMATDYTITLTGSNLSLEGAQGNTLTQSTETRTFTLVAAEGYKLPEVGDITVSITDGATIDNGAEDSKWSYSGGTITLGNSVDLTSGITVTANGVQKKDVATLATLQYQVEGGEATDVTGFSANTEPSGNYIVALDTYTNKDITVTATATAESNATLSAASVTVSAEDAVTTGATITVTSEDGSKTVEYKVMFTIPNDKLNEITVPSALSSGLTLSDRLSKDEVLDYLETNYGSFAITTEGSQDGLSLAVTWTLKDKATFNAAPNATNDFTWTIADETLVAAKLDKNSKTTTGDVTITNADASTTTVLSSLTYKIGADGQPANVTSDLTGEGTQTYAVELPFGTAVGTQIIVNVACKDNATAKVEGETATDKFTLTLNAGGETSLTLVITPESETPTRTVTINFTTEKELVTAVSGVPESYIFTQAVADEAAAIALLEAMDMSGITLTANSRVALKLKWEYSGGGFNNASGQSNNFTWTVVKEDGSAITAAKGVTATKTIAVTNYTVSTEAGISALTYQVAGGSKETISTVKEDPSTNDVTVAFGTKSITVSITPTDAKATVSLTDTEDHGTLIDGVTSYETPVLEQFKFTITAEDGQTTKNFIIKFIVDKEKITAVTVPATYKLPETAADVAAAIAMLEKMEGVIIKTNGVTPTKLSWTYEASKNGNNSYSNEKGKTHVFSWSAVRDGDGEALEAATGVVITGTTTVTNFMPAVTGNKPNETVKITADNPVDKIGDGETPTTVNIVEVPDGVTAKQLTINNAEIKGKLDLKGSVDEIVLNEVVIPEVVLAASKTTTLILQLNNKIDKIVNAGTMTLSNATMAPRSLAIETRAATVDNGSIGTVENNGTFTDKTATISTVKGNADLTISQPSDISTTGSSATLEVGATTTKGTITYLWEKYDNSNSDWVPANGTDAKLTVKKAEGNGKYRCQVTNTNTEDKATTTLYTHSASVTFRTSDPSTPSDPTPTPSTKTYTVTLKKVAGATFSQKESTTVDEGDNFSFTITLDKGYNQSKPVVKVGTTTYEPDAKGVYTIKNITKDITIEVSGIVKNTSTGIEETTEDAVRVWCEGSTLYIHTPQAADVYVVSGAGALMRQLKAVPGDQNIQLPAGFYIVRVGTYTAKVIIR